MHDLTCPYCDHTYEIELEGSMYEEDSVNETECPECEKYFVFSTWVSFSLHASKADCLNGEKHDYYPQNRYPVQEYSIGLYRCRDCSKEKRFTKKEAIDHGYNWNSDWDDYKPK